MATNALHGRFGALYVDQSATATAAASKLGNLMDWTVSGDRAQVETTCLGDTNVTRVAGLSDFTGDLNGIIDSQSTAIYTVGDGVSRKFYLYLDDTSAATRGPSSTAGAGYFYGYGLFAGVSTTGGVADAVKWSMKWAASGNVGRV
jgi:hypothetical protein